ncbi:hypothetical protein ACEPAG_2695 [Sanghuangporus baumii]
MIKSIEKTSVHRISSGQVLVDLQTAVKELVENSLDAGATTIDVKFRDYGVTSFEVSDNGSGISPEDYDNVAMKHHTSKLSTFEDLTTVQTFGFRGEALFSLCALSERVTITTATAKEAPMGTILDFDKTGKVKSHSGKTARQRGTTVYVEGLFSPLPVRRKELQRNSKREFGKALNLLSAYALVPCSKENKGVRLNVVHILDKGRKSDQIRTDGKPSLKASISSLWGPKQVESLTELNLDLEVLPEKTVLRRKCNADHDGSVTKIQIRGFISKFSSGHGRAGTDRQFFFINGRPCNPSKIQKAFNEVYRSFNTNQSPFIVADFIVPTNSYDINVSPDKRTILLHSENALVDALKGALEETFSPTRSTFAVQPTQSKISTAKNVKANDRVPEKSVTSTNGSQDAPTDPFTPDDTVVNDTSDLVSFDVPTTQRSPSPALAVPETLLESKKDQRSFVEESDQSVCLEATNPIASSSQSSLSRSADTELSIPSIQPRRRSASPVPADRRISSPGPAKPRAQVTQMVLDTSNASWGLRSADEEPARKKRRFDELKCSNPRAALRSQLSSYASGSQLAKLGDSSRDSVLDLADDAGDMEDELMDEELEEAKNDPEANHDNAAALSSGPLRWTVTNNNKANAAGISSSDPLFLPGPDELEVSRSVGQTQEEPIILDVDISGSESLLDTASTNHEGDEDQQLRTDSTSMTIAVSEADSSAPPTSSVGVEIVRTTDPSNDVIVSFGLELVDQFWDGLSSTGSSTALESPSLDWDLKHVDLSAGVSNTSDGESAEKELARVIDKGDFASMEIIGQFNLGFIIARRRLRGRKTSSKDTEGSDATPSSEELDDLFIIDQHAADEKYNFETLQQITKIDSQKLYKPRPLELTAADELLALENIDVLKSNGFEITVDETAEPSQGRIRLVAQPVSGSTNFDIKDFEELLHLMQDRSSGQNKMVRCSKARAMFAMRACRKSVMIGMALNKSQMTTIVRHMGTMDQPWNCPHGRPTMRHLTSLNDSAIGVRTLDNSGPSSREIKWDDL